MNKSSKELDLSSIVTQVARDDENNRSTPLNLPVVQTTPPTVATNGSKSSSQLISF